MRLRGHTTQIHYGAPSPTTRPGQRHFGPRDGDNLHAIDASAGTRFDANVNYVPGIIDPLDGKPGTILLAHYLWPWLNGYRFLPNGKKVPLRKRHWSYAKWGARGLELRRANGEHTLTLNGAVNRSAKVGAQPIPETKSRAFAKSDRPWQILAATFEHHDVPCWPKALVTMFGFKSKVIRAKKAGLDLAAIWGSKVRGRVARLAHTRAVERGWKDGTKVHATW